MSQPNLSNLWSPSDLALYFIPEVLSRVIKHKALQLRRVSPDPSRYMTHLWAALRCFTVSTIGSDRPPVMISAAHDPAAHSGHLWTDREMNTLSWSLMGKSDWRIWHLWIWRSSIQIKENTQSLLFLRNSKIESKRLLRCFGRGISRLVVLSLRALQMSITISKALWLLHLFVILA